MRKLLWLLGVGLLVGCNPRVTIEPITIEPIHITMDINVKVDRALDNFFDYEQQMGPALPAPATQPAPAAGPAGSLVPDAGSNPAPLAAGHDAAPISAGVMQ